MIITGKPKTERLYYIDQLKGIAIFLVVMGHFIQYDTISSKQSILFSIIYSFHMPLFIFLSGYVTEKTTHPAIFDTYSVFLKKKFITLMIPFFSWPLLIFPFLFGTDKHYQFWQYFTGLIQNPGGGLWYLWCLFFIIIIYSIFFGITIKLNKKQNLILDVLVCTVIFFFCTVLIFYTSSIM